MPGITTQPNIPVEFLTLYAMFDLYLEQVHGKGATADFDTLLNLLWHATVIRNEDSGESVSVRTSSYLDDILIDGSEGLGGIDFDILARDVSALADDGNFRLLSDDECKEFVDAISIEGINISTDLDNFEHLYVYVKGEKTVEVPEHIAHKKVRKYFEVMRDKRHFIGFVLPKFKHTPKTYLVFRSVLILYKQASIDYILSKELGYGNKKKASRFRRMLSCSSYLNNIYDSVEKKLKKRGIKESDFGNTGITLGKGVPSNNLEYLLPQSRISLGITERLKIGLTGGAKPTFAVITSFLKKKMLTYGAASLTLGFSALKGALTYINARKMIEDQVRKLTFEYIEGVGKTALSSLADQAERETAKEFGLAYHFLYSSNLSGPGKYFSKADIRFNVQRFVALRMPEETHSFSFHAETVLPRMEAFGVIRRHPAAKEYYQAVMPAECIPAIEKQILEDAKKRPGGNWLARRVKEGITIRFDDLPYEHKDNPID